jgi:putative membrane protein
VEPAWASACTAIVRSVSAAAAESRRGKTLTHLRYAVLLGGLFAAVWVGLSIAPLYRQDWLLENVLVLPFILGFALTFRRFPFSRVSYTLIFLFLCLHEIGAHYTYAEVPYDRWCETLTGHSLNSIFGWQRNQYDRFVHFAFGLLLAYPIREIFVRVAQAKGFWAYYLPLDVTMACSMLFELIEWGAAVVFGGDLGAAYLGTQGDPWDAHKDMALASLGATLAMLLTALINLRYQRDFAREWAESLRVKGKRPLGEEEFKKMIKP